jgi:hypothetical protein
MSSSSLCTNRRITLTRYAQELYFENRTSGFRLRIVASDACGMDNEIFRWFRAPPDLDGVAWDYFSGVCSSYELAALPKHEPGETDCPKQFRLSELDIILPSQHLAAEVWNLVQGDVEMLVETLDLAEQLVEEEIVEIGA